MGCDTQGHEDTGGGCKTEILYRKSLNRKGNGSWWLGEIIQTLAWLFLFSGGLFFAFAPNATQSKITNGLVGTHHVPGEIWFRLLGWIAIIFALWGLNCSFQWCRRHRPASRWDSKKGSYTNCSGRRRKKNRRSKSRCNTKDKCNPRPRRFIRDNCGAGSWDGSSSLFDGSLWKETGSNCWDSRGRVRSKLRSIFRIDLMQVLWVVIAFVLFTWLTLIVHSHKAEWYLSPAWYFDQFFLGGLLYYFIFRSIMVNKWRFIYNVLLTSAVVVLAIHLRDLFTPKPLYEQIGWFVVLDYVFLLLSTFTVAYSIRVKNLYEY